MSLKIESRENKFTTMLYDDFYLQILFLFFFYILFLIIPKQAIFFLIIKMIRSIIGADNGIRTRPNCLGSSYATTTSYPRMFLKKLSAM